MSNINPVAASQEVTMLASQLEVDPAAKAARLQQSSKNADEDVFIKFLENSMEEVHKLVHIEKEDPLRDDEEEELEDN